MRSRCSATVPIGDPKLVSDKEAEKVLGSVLDSGVTFVDTASDYWSSEERIGRFISHPGMSTTIGGTRNLDHLAENLDAIEAGPLSGDV